MDTISLQFSSAEKMMAFIRVNNICNYELWPAKKILVCALSEKEIKTAPDFGATIIDCDTVKKIG